MSTCEHDRQDDVCWECKDEQIETLTRNLATVVKERDDARAKAAWDGPWQQGAYTYSEAMDVMAKQVGDLDAAQELASCWYHQWCGAQEDHAKNGRLVEIAEHDLTAALARVATLEEESHVWDKHSLTQLIEERGELRERVAVLTEALTFISHGNTIPGFKGAHENPLVAICQEAIHGAQETARTALTAAREQAKETA